MKKITSALLALALVFSALPIFALESSSLLAPPDELSQAHPQHTSYTVKNGESIDFSFKGAEPITFLNSEGVLADSSEVRWDLLDNADGAFALSESKYTAIKDSGSATAAVYNSDGSHLCSIKLTASKNAASKSATGFKLSKTSYTIPVGTNEHDKTEFIIDILASPAGAVFSPGNRNELVKMFLTGGTFINWCGTSATVLEGGDGYDHVTLNVTVDTASDITEYIFGSATGGAKNKDASSYQTVTIGFLPDGIGGNLTPFTVNSQPVTRTATAKMRAVPPTEYTSISSKGSAVIQVGEKLSLASHVKLLPSNAAPSKPSSTPVSYSLSEYGGNDTVDYAVLDEAAGVVAGVSPGEVVVTASFTDTSSTTHSTDFVLRVIPFEPKPDLKMQLNTAIDKTIVGSSFNLVFDNYDLNAKIEYGSDDEAVISVDENGVVTAVGIGTTEVWAIVDGERQSYSVEVLPSATGVPATGIAELTRLF